MAINEKDIEEFEDMFDLSSKNDDDNDQAEEYGHSTDSSEPFDKLAGEVSETIQENEDKGHGLIKEDPHDIVKSVCVDGECSIPTLEVEEKEKSSVEEDDFFDDLPTRVEPKDGSSTEDAISNDDIESESDSSAVEKEGCSKSALSPQYDYKSIGGGSDQIEWMLESPSSMYNSLYQSKRDLLFKYMVGGQVEYTRWTQELEEAKVTIQGEVFDHQLIINQMEEVQQHRERVKSIHVRVNNQYFTFKRFVEMMRGFLARIEYLKPVVKQDGLVMEHMRDIELYYARLEALHDSSTKTEKMLAAAFDTLSRKCTICMELKPSERVEVDKFTSTSYTPKASTDTVREKSNEFDEFDDLPTNAMAAPIGHKTGAIGWGDI